jgi:hypothetical protein
MYSDNQYDQLKSRQSNAPVDNPVLQTGVRPMPEKAATDPNLDKSTSSAPSLFPTVINSRISSAFELSPEYRAWRDRNTVMGLKYYGRYGVYDGPRLTKPIDFFDACKVPILTLSSLLIAGLAIDSLSMFGAGALGLLLFAMTYLLVLLLRPNEAAK